MTTDAPRSISVKLKKAGWEVEITCTEAQVRQTIDSVLSSLDAASHFGLPGQVRPTEGSIVSGNKTARGLILDLWQEKWFSEPRSLSNVHEEIARRGFHYDKTAISHALTDLVRETTLTRQGYPRNYSYIQKRPPQPIGPGTMPPDTSGKGKPVDKPGVENGERKEER